MAAGVVCNVFIWELHYASVRSANELGMRVDGKRHWIHVVATDTLTWYDMH